MGIGKGIEALGEGCDEGEGLGYLLFSMWVAKKSFQE
jgi:hypothetical protein